MITFDTFRYNFIWAYTFISHISIVDHIWLKIFSFQLELLLLSTCNMTIYLNMTTSDSFVILLCVFIYDFLDRLPVALRHWLLFCLSKKCIKACHSFLFSKPVFAWYKLRPKSVIIGAVLWCIIKLLYF